MLRLDTTQPFAAPDSVRQRVQRDYERFATSGLPTSLEQYLLDEYDLDVTAEYGGFPLKNPWGKASGQLSMTARQVEEDVAAGLGFVVLKTVIAQDAQGGQSMAAWAIPEARMVAEPIVGHSGEPGWTITWKGRGWWQPFEAYLQLIRDARRIADSSSTLIVPSCKYHLPSPNEPDWRVGEYDFTTAKMLEAFRPDASPMPLEKDFSPTLAGSDRAAAQAKILEWLRVVPKLVRDSAAKSGLGQVRIGMKLFNALFDDDFQLQMFDAIHGSAVDRPDFFIYANRLFDPNREFDGQRGVAFGGPDLSDRNLRALDQWRATRARSESFDVAHFCDSAPKGQPHDSPGQRPGNESKCGSEALKGRHLQADRDGVAPSGLSDALHSQTQGDAPDGRLPWANLLLPLRGVTPKGVSEGFAGGSADDPSLARRTSSPLPWSATGNITTGRMAVEYLLRGATSFQLHTFFQLPAEHYAMKIGNRTQRALHELHFHPQTGFVVWLHHLANQQGVSGRPIRLLEIARG